MKTGNIYSHICIDDQSITPKYRQLTNSIVRGIESGNLKKNYVLPSINALSDELDISRDTAEKAYRNLKNIGIIGSVRRNKKQGLACCLKELPTPKVKCRL